MDLVRESKNVFALNTHSRIFILTLHSREHHSINPVYNRGSLRSFTQKHLTYLVK